MLVDHFIDFKGCNAGDHSHDYDENEISMSEFVNARNEILQQFPILAEPDFAQDDRLPAEARNYENDGMNDNWAKRLTDSLDHMTAEEWNGSWMKVKELFTGGEELKHLAIGKNDITFSKSRVKRKMAKGQVAFDIDSILAMFTDLSVINTVIGISIISNPMKNLKHSVHLAHQGAPLHHIPHFHLGHFGHDPKFDLYVMLPALYDKKIKREKGKLHNHVPEDIRAEFMDTCFLPAVEEVMGRTEGQSWDYKYDVAKAKSTAAAKEGNMYHKQPKAFRQETPKDLDAKYIDLVWHNCERRLMREMRRGGKLEAFEGFQFFINSKGHKHRTKTDEFSKLMTIYKRKVRVRTNFTDDNRSRATLSQPRSIFIDSMLTSVLLWGWTMNLKRTVSGIHGCGGIVA